MLLILTLLLLQLLLLTCILLLLPDKTFVTPQSDFLVVSRAFVSNN